MVKPPKTMQPECASIDLSKAGRSSGKSFQEDSFRNYMARKIDMQRKQFGLVLPPPPASQQKQQHQRGSPKSKSSVRFNVSNEQQEKKKSPSNMSHVLRRLKSRHGNHPSQLTMKNKKQKIDHLGEKKYLNQSCDVEVITAKSTATTNAVSAVSPSTKSLISPRKPSRRLRSDLFFTGVVIMVNGYTNPDDVTLQRLLHKHGGDLEKYETSRVTHIIAEHLSRAKANIYKKQRRPKPICKPQWILDCVKEKKLLPYGKYLIDEVKGTEKNNYFHNLSKKNLLDCNNHEAKSMARKSSNFATSDNYNQWDNCLRGEINKEAASSDKRNGLYIQKQQEQQNETAIPKGKEAVVETFINRNNSATKSSFQNKHYRSPTTATCNYKTKQQEPLSSQHHHYHDEKDNDNDDVASFEIDPCPRSTIASVVKHHHDDPSKKTKPKSYLSNSFHSDNNHIHNNNMLFLFSQALEQYNITDNTTIASTNKINKTATMKTSNVDTKTVGIVRLSPLLQHGERVTRTIMDKSTTAQVIQVDGNGDGDKNHCDEEMGQNTTINMKYGAAPVRATNNNNVIDEEGISQIMIGKGKEICVCEPSTTTTMTAIHLSYKHEGNTSSPPLKQQEQQRLIKQLDGLQLSLGGKEKMKKKQTKAVESHTIETNGKSYSSETKICLNKCSDENLIFEQQTPKTAFSNTEDAKQNTRLCSNTQKQYQEQRQPGDKNVRTATDNDESQKDLTYDQDYCQIQDDTPTTITQQQNTKANGNNVKRQLHFDNSSRDDSHHYQDTGVGVTDKKYINGKLRTVGTDPNFLESYFKSSRLSFIGSYKQRVEKKDIAASPEKKYKSTDYSSSSTPYDRSRRFVFHVDMDCFFVAVVLRNYPQYRGKPVAIAHHGQQQPKQSTTETVLLAYQHSYSTKGSTSECATCNYEARKYGVKKGMFLGRAKELCPNLVVLPYDFDGYEEVTEQVTDILYRYASTSRGEVEQVSCDESYVELSIVGAESALPLSSGSSGSNNDDDAAYYYEQANAIASKIRKEIYEITQCTASIGVGPNKFLAKLATDKVKPNGSFVVRGHEELLQKLKLKDMHGIGYRSSPKLAAEGLVTVQDVWNLGGKGLEVLSRVLGPGLGKKIFGFCNGEDDRPVKPVERKTIGAECNYGVRFDGPYGVDYMIAGLAKEVEKRMTGVGVLGSRITLKIKQKKQGAGQPGKFLGHGSCHNLSKSSDLRHGSYKATRDREILKKSATQLFNELTETAKVFPVEIRGMGIVVSKLIKESDNLQHHDEKSSTSVSEQSIKKWFNTSVNKRHNATFGSEIELKKCKDKTSPRQHEQHDENIMVVDGADSYVIEDKVFTVKNRHGINVETSQVQNCPPPSDEDQEKDTGKAYGSTGSKVIELVQENISSQHSRDEAFVIDIAGDSQHTDVFLREEVDNDIQDDVVIPPLSQLHMSQVNALPSPLRKRIFCKISDEQNEKTSLPVLDPPPVHRHAAYAKDRCHQTSIKRMLRLAAVKSGKETLISASDKGEKVSLTQLDCLPLDLQLQVANNDAISLGGNEYKKKEVSDHLTTNVDHFKAAQAPSINNTQLKQITWEDAKDGEMLQVSQDMDVVCLVSFYQDNVLPLKLFMDDNPNAEQKCVEKVQEFFNVCITEYRLHDVVVLLRIMRNRQDCWGKMEAYNQVLNAVDDMCSQVFQCRLDLGWLGLSYPS